MVAWYNNNKYIRFSSYKLHVSIVFTNIKKTFNYLLSFIDTFCFVGNSSAMWECGFVVG